MKKFYLTLLFALALILCLGITAFAADIRIEADELSDIHSAINDSVAGDTVTIDLVADIGIPNTSSAIKLEKDITVIINFNNHIIVNAGGGGGAGSVYGMLVKSRNAKLVLNGSKTEKLDYVNYKNPGDEQIKFKNGVITNPNVEKAIEYPDYASDGPAIVVFSGSIELNDLYINQYNTGEWAIFLLPNMGSGVEVVNNIKITNSVVKSASSRYAAIGTRQGNSDLVECLVEIENCVLYGTGSTEWISMGANSYVRNSRIKDNVFKIDSYMSSGYAGIGSEAVLQGVIFENQLQSCTGAIYVNMIDCSFENNMNVYVVGDSKGKTIFTMIESATCDKAGRKASIESYKGGSKTLTSFESLTTVDEQYSIDNPALGHTPDLSNVLDIVYENGFINKGTCVGACIRCGTQGAKEIEPSAEALIAFIGISTEQNGYGICVGYTVNYEAIELYESYGKTFEYGVAACIKGEGMNELELVNTDLSAASYAVVAGISSPSFDFKILGFTDEYYELELVMCAYVYDGNEVDYVNVAINGKSVSLSQDDYATTITMKQVVECTK